MVVYRVGDYLYVKYIIAEDGWCLTETHLHIGDSLDDIPQTKGNPIPGHFNYPMDHDCITEYAYPPIDVSGFALPLYIAAHAKVIKLIGSSTGWQWATQVIDYTQGTLVGGDPVTDPLRTNPTSALGLPDGSTSPPATGFYSLGFDGYIVLGFNFPIYNGPNPDVRTVEVTWGRSSYPREAAKVYAMVGNMEYDLGTVTNNDNPDGTSYVSFDVVPAGVYIDAIKLVDDTYKEDFSGPGYENANGFDLDAVGVRYLVEAEETAWGDGEDFPGNNWATYFEYESTIIPIDFNPTWMEEGSGVWLATDYEWTPNTFDPDPLGAPTLDLDDKLILQKAGGHGEGDYNLPSPPPNPGANHRVWWDRDGVDPWQNGETANTGGIYQIIITLHATSSTTGTAYMNIRGLDQGFETDGDWDTIELTPAGMTFTGDMEHLQVFYGLYGYGATHSVSFTGITVTQG